MTDVGAGLPLLDAGDVVAGESVTESLVDVDLGALTQLIRCLALQLACERVDLQLQLLPVAIVLDLHLEKLRVAVLFEGPSLLIQVLPLRHFQLTELGGGLVALGREGSQLFLRFGFDVRLRLLQLLLHTGPLHGQFLALLLRDSGLDLHELGPRYRGPAPRTAFLGRLWLNCNPCAHVFLHFLALERS